MRRPPEVRGLHGIALRVSDPEAFARRLRQLTGIRVLRRNRSEIVLGTGPEMFLSLRRAAAEESAAVAELHVAVEKLSATGRRGEPDALGGLSWRRQVTEDVAVVVREFATAPSGRWRAPRPKKAG